MVSIEGWKSNGNCDRSERGYKLGILGLLANEEWGMS